MPSHEASYSTRPSPERLPTFPEVHPEHTSHSANELRPAAVLLMTAPLFLQHLSRADSHPSAIPLPLPFPLQATHRCHFLQVDRHNLDLVPPRCIGGASSGEHLRPRARRRAQVHHACDPFKEAELVVELEKFIRRARPPALLLGTPVVDVALVL
eukprot:scaffold2776_cov36-Tisochrysis_lutea.AAC.1